VHLALAHHGRVEFGSPKTPLTLEALLTHYIDELDSRVNSWLNLMGRQDGNRRWTSADNVYEQPIWRGPLPTTQAEKKGPAPEVLSPVIYVPREGSRQSRPEPSRKPQRPKPPRPAQEQKPAGETKAAEDTPGEAKVEARPEGAAARPERPPRPDRPDRGGFRGGPGGGHGGPGGAGGFGDKKRGYTGPRQPGDRGPQARPAEKKLTHNPFAALAAKLEGEKPEAAPAGPTPAAEPASEPTPQAPAEPQSPDTSSGT
jgi:3'-5' exoribonuclease